MTDPDEQHQHVLTNHHGNQSVSDWVAAQCIQASLHLNTLVVLSHTNPKMWPTWKASQNLESIAPWDLPLWYLETPKMPGLSCWMMRDSQVSHPNPQPTASHIPEAVLPGLSDRCYWGPDAQGIPASSSRTALFRPIHITNPRIIK